MEIKPFVDDIDTMEYIKSLIEIANTQNIGFLNNFYEFVIKNNKIKP